MGGKNWKQVLWGRVWWHFWFFRRVGDGFDDPGPVYLNLYGCTQTQTRLFFVDEDRRDLKCSNSCGIYFQ